MCFFSEGIKDKAEYEKNRALDRKILNLLQSIEISDYCTLTNDKGDLVSLTKESIDFFLDGIRMVHGFGPNHPLIKNIYILDLGSKLREFKIELIKALMSNKETVYINVIVGDKPNGVFKEFRYFSDELIAWAQKEGIIEP